ncbi:DUF6503 family protein [Robertkochia aurantiaca]|uniref:DUF6503 family protein n=1 Tax=Robertkochia aurantiaca TaxID=2873700 RepID=UPI001CCB3A3D|nr:DUF6503 family protein [Robertkochia sp. 3YJGBD-33]
MPNKYLLLGAASLAALTSCTREQKPTAQQLLDKTIAYHDPDNAWEKFEGELEIVLEMPESSDRITRITLDRPDDYFRAETIKDSTVTVRTYDKGQCTFTLNGRSELSQDEIETHRGSCERTAFMKDYYSYLYGLPMKLRDPGTQLQPEVKLDTFQNKTYYVLKVSYDPEVGKDTWSFYINPETYAMEAYQFVHNDNGKGEYILLEGLDTIKGMMIPKDRHWYTNEGKFLGSDRLRSAE